MERMVAPLHRISLVFLIARLSIVDAFHTHRWRVRNSEWNAKHARQNRAQSSTFFRYVCSNILPDTTRLSSSYNDSSNRLPLRKGSTVAIVTPMTSDLKVDIEALRELLRFHVESMTDGLCILGTTGEASTLSMPEREKVLTTAVEEVKGKIPILAGTGTIDPVKVREMTLQAIDLGCDACLVVTPYYVKPPQRCLVKHFQDIADLGLPVVMYNVPGRTGVDLLPETIGLCAQHPNVVAVKEATGDLSRISQIKTALKDVNREDFLLYSGDDGTCVDFVLGGGHGTISVTANVLPARVHDVMLAALQGKSDISKELNKPLELINERLFIESNPIPVKWALSRMKKIPCASVRAPLGSLDKKHYAAVEDALEQAGAI